jgi:uncharacterized protein (TIGR03435 family)
LNSDVRARVLILVLAGISAPHIWAQPAASTGIAFEAASIRQSKPGDSRRPLMEFLPGGRFRTVNTPFIAILGTAYNVPWQSIESFRIKGVANSMLAERYDIEATADKASISNSAPARSRNRTIRLMLQAVLADRFKLKIIQQTEVMPVYAVTVGSHGSKLEKAQVAPDECSESAPFGGSGCHQFLGGAGRGIRGAAVDMADLALYVSNWSDAPLVDETGLTGLFTVQTEGWSSTPGDDPSRPTLFLIFERLGLKLVRKKTPVDVFVVEHVERPSAN